MPRQSYTLGLVFAAPGAILRTRRTTSLGEKLSSKSMRLIYSRHDPSQSGTPIVRSGCMIGVSLADEADTRIKEHIEDSRPRGSSMAGFDAMHASSIGS